MDWIREATAVLGEGEPTPLRTGVARFGEGIGVHVKDETAQPTGNLKHRLVRDLLLKAVIDGDLREGMPIVEATGGGAALALGHFANRLGLPFTCVMPARAHPSQIAAVEALGGTCELVDPPLAIYAAAERLAAERGGHYLDMFARAEAATDWRSGGVAGEILAQSATEPAWIVCGAGTGITSATAGRHLRYTGAATRVAVADPEHSSYFPAWASGYDGYATGMPSRVPGIGRPRVEPAFRIDLVDAVVPVPDAAAAAATRYLAERHGLAFGPAAGACFWAAMILASKTADKGETGDLVVVAGEGGEAYRGTFYDDAWLAAKGLDPEPHRAVLDAFDATGTWTA